VLIQVLSTFFARRWTRDEGASVLEYALIVAAIALVCLLAVEVFGGSVDTMYDDSGDSIAAVSP
jgi:Flp pilus assembly pilin Flp